MTTVAVVGATGLVGREMLKILEQRSFPAERVVPLASARSAGASLIYRGEELTVREATVDRFDGDGRNALVGHQIVALVPAIAAVAAGVPAVGEAHLVRGRSPTVRDDPLRRNRRAPSNAARR